MPEQDPLPPLEWSPKGVQIQGFSAGLHQIEWLLVTVVILYLVIIGLPDAGTDLLTTANLAPVGTSIIALLIVGYLTASLVHVIHVSNRSLLKMASRASLTGLYKASGGNRVSIQVLG